MILGFGGIMLVVLGAIGAAFAAPLAALLTVLSRREDDKRGGGAILRRWVLCTAVVIVVLCLGLSGNAAHGIAVYGVQIEDLLVQAPWLLLLAAGIHFKFGWPRRPSMPPRRPPNDD